MVDWSLARQVARFAAGSQPAQGPWGDLDGHVGAAETAVASYTGLELSAPAPRPELVSRAEWAELNLDSLARLLDPVAERLDGRFEHAGPLAGPLRAATSATLAAEAGLVMGYASQRVLGQYELSLLAPDVPPRLLFVGPNIERAVLDLKVDRQSFLGWVAAHEVTHVFQFGGVPWLRDHLGALMRSYLETVEVRIARGSAGGLPSLPNPADIVQRFQEGGLAALVQTREQRELMNHMQAVMAVIEGYSEHVMDAVAPDLVPEHEGLRHAMDRRRASRSAPERIIQRLLGLDMKLKQYELGHRFCDAVVAEKGTEKLNRVWEGPEALPSLAEVSRPSAWIERIEQASTAIA